MCELMKKVNRAISYLKSFEPLDEPYYVCYSGGKDSDVIRILCDISGVKYDLVHNLTSVDSPETVNYVKSIPNIIINKPRWPDGTHKTMWNLIPTKLSPPTRKIRYCCSELKEFGGKGHLKVTGVRSSESKNRSENSALINIISRPKSTIKYLESNSITYSLNNKGGITLNYDNSDSRRAVEHCFRTASTLINPILDWSDSDVWEFLHFYNCSSNPLYQCGFTRVGCIGCPLSSKLNMRYEFSLYPKIYYNYLRSFEKLVLKLDSPFSWRSGEDVMKWWLLDSEPDQLSFDDFGILDLY